MAQRYNKPPIIEAVIALSFAEAIDQRALEKLRDKLGRTYPNAEPQVLAQVSLGALMSSVQQQSNGFRLADNDQHNVLLMTPKELVISVLPPYPGWEELRDRSARDFALIKSITGYRSIARLALLWHFSFGGFCEEHFTMRAS